MANPDVITLTEDTWVKVATNVTTGGIWEMSSIARILMTQRDTGDAAPTDNSDAVHIFVGDCNYIPISSDAGKDIYLKAVNNPGKVRVDL